jgi:hypothetical protein
MAVAGICEGLKNKNFSCCGDTCGDEKTNSPALRGCMRVRKRNSQKKSSGVYVEHYGTMHLCHLVLFHVKVMLRAWRLARCSGHLYISQGPRVGVVWGVARFPTFYSPTVGTYEVPETLLNLSNYSRRPGPSYICIYPGQVQDHLPRFRTAREICIMCVACMLYTSYIYCHIRVIHQAS